MRMDVWGPRLAIAAIVIAALIFGVSLLGSRFIHSSGTTSHVPPSIPLTIGVNIGQTGPPTDALLPVGPVRSASCPFGVDVYDQWLPNDPVTPRIIRYTAEMGVKWMRVELRWEEREPRAGHFDWRYPDDILPLLRKYGITPEFLVFKGAKIPEAGFNGVPLPSNPAYYRLWLGYLRAAARHYSRIMYWEIWNEPNVPSVWNGKSSPQEYAQMVVDAAHVIRAVNPQAQIILSGTGLIDALFTQAVLQARARPLGGAAVPVRSQVRGTAFHPYELLGVPEDVHDQASGRDVPYPDAVRTLQSATGMPPADLWANEQAFYSNSPPVYQPSNLTLQAVYLARRSLVSASLGIQDVDWFYLFAPPNHFNGHIHSYCPRPGERDLFPNYALLGRCSPRPTPALNAFSAVTSVLCSTPHPTPQLTDQSNEYSLSFTTPASPVRITWLGGNIRSAATAQVSTASLTGGISRPVAIDMIDGSISPVGSSLTVSRTPVAVAGASAFPSVWGTLGVGTGPSFGLNVPRQPYVSVWSEHATSPVLAALNRDVSEARLLHVSPLVATGASRCFDVLSRGRVTMTGLPAGWVPAHSLCLIHLKSPG